MDWIKTSERTPDLIEGQNYSSNVFAVKNGQLAIMCYCYINGEGGGFVWADCNGNIDGDAEFDDDMGINYWMPLPELPLAEK